MITGVAPASTGATLIFAPGGLSLWINNLYRRFGAGRLSRLGEKRRATSRFIGRGKFVDGGRQADVSLALTQTTLFFENASMASSLDLQWIREVSYQGDVLRLTSDSQLFEFVLPADDVPRWHLMLPKRRMRGSARFESALAPSKGI